MYTPSREEFVAAAARGNLIPVYRELLADGDTPVSAYAALGGGEHSFLLESVVGGATWAAYSFVGVAPRAVVRWAAGTATVTWYDVDGGGPPRTAEWATPDPTAALAEVLGELRPVDVPGLPRFWGGAVGWIAYDCVRAFEELPGARAARPRPAAAVHGRHRHAADLRQPAPDAEGRRHAVRRAARARRGRRTSARARGSTRSSRRCARRAAAARARAAAARRARRRPTLPPSSFTQADFLAAVDRVKEYILAGDAFQVVLSQRFSEPRRRRAPARRLPRAARDQPVAVHVPPRVPRGARHRRVARDAGPAQRRPRRGPADRRHASARRDRRRGRAPRRGAARRSEGARRAPDADRSRPQRRRPRRRGRHRAGHRADGRSSATRT